MKKEYLPPMKNEKVKPKTSFWTWLHYNRLKVVIIAFVVLVPLSLILTAYIGSYTANRVVNFDTEITADTVYVKHFLEYDDIDAFNLNIVWTDLKHPHLDLNSNELVGGYYIFDVYYEAKENYVVKSVTITPVLQTDWKDLRSIGSSTNLLIIPKAVLIRFNYGLPVNPLLFVQVNEPHLYLKVDYVLTTAGTDVSFTKYVEFSLKDINPLNVIS